MSLVYYTQGDGMLGEDFLEEMKPFLKKYSQTFRVWMNEDDFSPEFLDNLKGKEVFLPTAITHEGIYDFMLKWSNEPRDENWPVTVQSGIGFNVLGVLLSLSEQVNTSLLKRNELSDLDQALTFSKNEEEIILIKLENIKVIDFWKVYRYA